MMETELDGARTATARSWAYHLLGKLFLEGVTEEVADHIRSVDDLADHLDTVRDDSGALDFDEAAAAYQDLFGFNVFPFQSTFLDETARAGGAETERVTDFYREASFPVVETAESPDHIGVELNFLGFLSKLEAEAPEEGGERARGYARRFLDDHLLLWLPSFVLALRDHGQPFFVALGELTLETALDHRRALEGTTVEVESKRLDGFELPGPPELLEDPKTGLRDIAEYLLVPAYTGMYLSRGGIRGLSRQEQLPAGFGSRKIMLSNLLRSAADYDGLQQVTAKLEAFVEQNREYWRSFADGPAPQSAVASMWDDRLERTEAILGRIREAHAELEGDDVGPDRDGLAT